MICTIACTISLPVSVPAPEPNDQRCYHKSAKSPSKKPAILVSNEGRLVVEAPDVVTVDLRCMRCRGPMGKHEVGRPARMFDPNLDMSFASISNDSEPTSSTK